ncbi:hypothetical protein G3A39_39145 [Paraburkholderia aspalathi]|nr:hypothetical protein [Paraburkholderia aspalathi]
MDKISSATLNRRSALEYLLGGAIMATSLLATEKAKAAARLSFDELYASFGVLGLKYSEKVLDQTGSITSIKGFMAPPLKAEADFFVLTEIPMALCPFCSSDADWPDNILVVYLGAKQTFVQPSTTIEVTGTLERGSWTDPETGFVSLLRLRNASYQST